MPLYKFIKTNYSKSFFKKGSLRLGTIYSFKDTVEHGQNIGDESEGKHEVIRSLDEPVTLSKDKPEPIVSEIFKVSGDGKVHVENIAFVVPRRSPDAFIFSTCYLFSDSLFKRWFDEEKYDACYEIFDVKGFYRSISEAVNSSARFWGNGNVEYIDDPIDYSLPAANLNPALTKQREKYGWQMENRAIWVPRGPCGPLKPWVKEVPPAPKYCRPYAYIEDGVVRYVNA